MCGAREQSLIITPEIASQNNSCAKSLKYSHAEFRQGLKEIPRHRRKTYHSTAKAMGVSLNTVQVVAKTCLSHTHVFAEAYIDGGEQDIKDGVGIVVH